MDQLTYNYDLKKPNRLLWVDDAEGDVPDADDLGDQEKGNYQYNSIGQLTKDVSEGITYIYTASGLVAEVLKNGQPLVKFFYNDRNHRVRKEVYGNGNLIYTIYYVRDVAGQTMAVYNDVGGDPALEEQPVYGAGRIGIAYNGNNNEKTYVYELTDHLGNVRAVFTKAENDANLEGYTDYYPFGMPMPNRTLLGPEGYRYAFQGQEKDPETGKEAFQLRLWDSRIGRWLTTDPYGQYASPYLGMGNDPINRIDPDGGFDWYKDKETGEIVWFDGSYDVEGFEHLGFNYMEIDAFSNRSFYDGDTQSLYLNGEFQRSYLNEVSVTSFINQNYIDPVASVTQTFTKTLVNGFHGAFLGFAQGVETGDFEGIKIDGSELALDMNQQLTYNNGKWITIDPFSQGEDQYIKDYFVDATSVSLNKVPTGPVKTGNSFVDFISNAIRDIFITETVDNTMNSVH